jgi:two-component system sensor kinase FixL
LISFARACQDVLQSPAARERQATAIELIDQTVQQAVRAGAIIRSTREFLQRGDTRLTAIEIPVIFRAVLDLVTAEANLQKVEIALDQRGGLPLVFVDPIQVEQVIINLVRNSIEAMVAAGHTPRRIVLSASLAADPAFVQIGVRDNGPGFSPDLSNRVFQPFATTKEAGMGLGLSISRSIVETHGGRIWIEAGRDRGADIRFTLPIHVDTSDEQ